MNLEEVALQRQMEIAFYELWEELRYLASGTVFIQIRADVIGKFGIRHYPVEMNGAAMTRREASMTDSHLQAFTELALASLDYKKGWTHGEIYFEFAMRKGTLCASVQFESHYNMANVFAKLDTKRRSCGRSYR